MTDSREVEFFQVSEQRNLLDEIADELTSVQMARLSRQIARLKQYGWALDGSFFDNVADSKKKLREFRMTLDKVEYRLLFSEEPDRIFVILAGYKEKRNSIPKSAISTAESRLETWRGRRQEQVKDQATKSPGNRGWQK